MRKPIGLAALGCLGLALGACGSTDDRSTEAAPETVEQPAEAALASVNEEPVADPDAAGPTDAQEADANTVGTSGTGGSGEPQPDAGPPTETSPETPAETVQEGSE